MSKLYISNAGRSYGRLVMTHASAGRAKPEAASGLGLVGALRVILQRYSPRLRRNFATGRPPLLTTAECLSMAMVHPMSVTLVAE